MLFVAAGYSDDVSILQLVLGIVALALGSFMIVRREAIVARHRRRLGPRAQPPMLWIVLGCLLAVCGLVEFVAAAAS